MRHLVVTGLTLRSPLHGPLFAYHAMRSFSQARADPACLHAEARTFGAVAHTITLWRDAAAARTYGTSGAHRQASAVFPKIAFGKVWSGPADTAPSWSEARRLWTDSGTIV